MSQACGTMEFLEGGIIKDATIISSQIVDSRITGSVLDSSMITNLAGIDSSSIDLIVNGMNSSNINTIVDKLSPENIQTIVDHMTTANMQAILEGLMALPTSQLTLLANLLAGLVSAAPTVVAGDPSWSGAPDSVQLPTNVYGNRTALLGKPEAFVKFDDTYIVPVYRVGQP